MGMSRGALIVIIDPSLFLYSRLHALVASYKESWHKKWAQVPPERPLTHALQTLCTITTGKCTIDGSGSDANDLAFCTTTSSQQWTLEERVKM